MRRTIVSACVGSVTLSMLLVASTAFAQAPAAGTTVAVKMLDTVDSNADAAGRQYRASVARAVTDAAGIAIGQGAAAVVTLTRSGAGYAAQLISITINGQVVAVTSNSATVAATAQNAQARATGAVNSVLGSLGHHVSAPAPVAAAAAGQHVSLPTGTTLTFVLGNSPVASAPAPAATVQQTASAAPNAAPVATAGQHWWMCRYKDLKDPSKPALGSLMYYALFPTSEPLPGGLNAHYNAYIQQNYKIVDKNNAGNGFCQRYSDDATARTYSMNLMIKEWTAGSMQPVQVAWSDTPAENAATAARTPAPTPRPAATGGSFIACATSGGAGIDTYVTGVFQTTRVKHTPSGGNLVDQAILDDFYAYLKQKGYNFKPGSNYGCAVKPTEADAKADEQKRTSGCSSCGKVVETGWKE